MSTKKFFIEYPKSQANADFEPFEYLLRWIGRDGSDYVYMFYDAQLSVSIETAVINRESDINSMIVSNENEIELTADDLSKNDMLIVAEIMEQKQVKRLRKDGTVELYAPDSNSFNYRLLGGRYNISFKLIAEDTKTWR